MTPYNKILSMIKEHSEELLHTLFEADGMPAFDPHKKAIPILNSILNVIGQLNWNSNIEEAPRDGTKIILYIQKGSDGFICLGFWQSIARTEDRKFSDLSEKKRALMYKNGGYWSSHFKGEKPLQKLPTHWMPLPPPPTSTE